jgi:hypothetical protein
VFLICMCDTTISIPSWRDAGFQAGARCIRGVLSRPSGTELATPAPCTVTGCRYALALAWCALRLRVCLLAPQRCAAAPAHHDDFVCAASCAAMVFPESSDFNKLTRHVYWTILSFIPAIDNLDGSGSLTCLAARSTAVWRAAPGAAPPDPHDWPAAAAGSRSRSCPDGR